MQMVSHFHQVHAAHLVGTRDGSDGADRVGGDAEVAADGVPGAARDDAERNAAMCQSRLPPLQSSHPRRLPPPGQFLWRFPP